METLVLCPEELCLSPTRPEIGHSSDYGIWSSVELEKGTRFLPWKGTVRTDKIRVFDKLPDFDIRHRFGLYDEVSEVSPDRRLRQCNWIRFLRYTLVYNEDVNLVGSKSPTGEPQFEILKDVDPKTELVCFFVPERPEESFLLPAIQYLRHTLFKRLLDNVLEESPLDLSKTTSFPAPSPTTSEGGRKSVSSDCASVESNANAASSPQGVLDVLKAAVAVAQQQQQQLSLPPSSPAKSPSPPQTSAMRPPVIRRREKKELPCHYCGKAFDRPSLLKRHIRIHTGERPHVCDICSKGFSTSSSLNTHRRIHSGEKPHQCGVCGKCFTASSNLYYHKMTHVKEKPHKCTMCSKSFPTPGDLKSHTYVHTGTWPFKCHICHRGFSKQTNLKNHLLLHSGDKPFSCDICHKKFALSCNLRAHLKTHEAEYQNSAASLALYQRALAVLGSQSANGIQPPSNEEESDPQSPDTHVVVDDEDDDDEDEDERSSTENNNNNNHNKNRPTFANHLTVTV